MNLTKTLSVSLNGLQLSIAINYRSTSNKLLVFLHGLGCHQEAFRPAFDHVDLSDYSICTLDFPGFGESDKPSNFSYSIRDQATVLLYALDQLDYEQVSLVAHSMGGAIGLLAADNVKNLKSFVNVEGNLTSTDCGIVSRQIAKQTELAFVTKGYDALLKQLQKSERNDYKIWAKWYEKSSPIAIHRSAKSLVEESDSGKLLEQFNSLPNKSYIYGDSEREYLLPLFHQTNVKKIVQSGHFPMIDNPDAFYKVIAKLCS